MEQVTTTGIDQAIEVAVQWINNGTLPPADKFLLILLLRNGLRVSEITNPANIRKVSATDVSVYCFKNKITRICPMYEAAAIEKEYNIIQTLSGWQRSRWYYYRLMKGLLPDVETSRLKNTAVTHAARNIRAQQVYQATGDIEATKASIGNKSAKATERYINQKPKGAKAYRGVKGAASGEIGVVQVTKKGVIRLINQAI